MTFYVMAAIRHVSWIHLRDESELSRQPHRNTSLYIMLPPVD